MTQTAHRRGSAEAPESGLPQRRGHHGKCREQLLLFSARLEPGNGGDTKQTAPAPRMPRRDGPPSSSGTRGVDGVAILIERLRLRSEGRTPTGLTFPVLLKVGFLMAGTLGAGRRGRRGATPAAGSAADGAWSPRAVAVRASPRAPATCSVYGRHTGRGAWPRGVTSRQPTLPG